MFLGLIFICSWRGNTCFSAEKPRLEFMKIIGDMRGRSWNSYAVGFAENGEICQLVTRNRVAVYSPEGKYIKTLAFANPKNFQHPYLSISGKLILVGGYETDYPWVFAPTRKGTAPGD